MILNPISKELNVMRQTLLYSGMECVVRNLNHKCLDQKLYEFGRTYVLNHDYIPVDAASVDVTKKYIETQHLSLFMTGATAPENWKQKQAPVDFYNLKEFVMNILSKMRINVTRLEFVPATEKFYAEGYDVVLRDSKKLLLSFGRLGRELLKKMDCKQEVFYADFNWSLMLKNYPDKEVTYKELPKFPEVRRDLALVIDKGVTFAEIEKVAYSTEKKLLKSVSLFDVYEGKGVEDGKKSYAVSFILQDNDKTLTDKQIESVMAKLQGNFEKQLGAKLRG